MGPDQLEWALYVAWVPDEHQMCWIQYVGLGGGGPWTDMAALVQPAESDEFDTHAFWNSVSLLELLILALKL